MNTLVHWLAETIRARVSETRFSGPSTGESRLIFHGPPLEVLSHVYQALVDGKHPELSNLPVLLQVPRLEAGQQNPSIGASGHCDESHLLDLRNSPTASSYLALVPPGQHAIRSVSSTTDEFGVSASNNGGNIPFEDWLSDSFIQRVVESAVELTKSPQQSEATELFLKALRSVDDVDEEKPIRSAAWRLISRMFAVSGDGGQIAREISLACGVPPMTDDKLSASEQQSILEGIAGALSDGFRSGLAEALDTANDDQKEWLEGFLSHIRSTCDVPTALERAPEAFYAPALGLELTQPPHWWLGLTAELWAELLTDEPEVAGDIQIECERLLLPASKGAPALVENEIDLVIRARSAESGTVDVTLERSPGKNKDGFPAQVTVEGEFRFQDGAPPAHKSAVQYKASADRHRPASIKVVSLASWLPGIYVACRVARKLSTPRAPARRSKGPQWEASLSLPGPGRYELLVFLRPGATIAAMATGTAGGEGNGGQDSQELNVREVRHGLHQIEVEAEGGYQVDIEFGRPDAAGRLVPETCRVFLSCEEIIEDGCRSEFERLIKLNRRQIESVATKPTVQLGRSARSSSLQSWMLQEGDVSRSYLPS